MKVATLEKFHLRGGGGIKILGTQGWEKLGGEDFFSFKQGGNWPWMTLCLCSTKTLIWSVTGNVLILKLFINDRILIQAHKSNWFQFSQARTAKILRTSVFQNILLRTNVFVMRKSFNKIYPLIFCIILLDFLN